MFCSPKGNLGEPSEYSVSGSGETTRSRLVLQRLHEMVEWKQRITDLSQSGTGLSSDVK